MALWKEGLSLGQREPRGGSGALTPCKRSRGGAQLGVCLQIPVGRIAVALVAQLFQARPPRGRCPSMPFTHRQGGGLRINSPHGAGFIGGSHPINRMPIFLADTNNSQLLAI